MTNYTDQISGVGSSPTPVDAITGGGQGLGFKAPVRVATTANITLSGLQTIDGVTLVADDRVLVKNQTTAANNGIYIASTGVWTRARDFDENRDVTQGTRVAVVSGTANADKEFAISTANPISVGTTNIAFAEVSIGADAAAEIVGSGAFTQPTGVLRTVQNKLEEFVSGDDFDIDKTGATNCLADFKLAVALLSSGGRLVLRKGIYDFTMASESDCILLPSDFHLYMEEGVLLRRNSKWPQFVVTEKENVLIEGGMFEWGGTLDTSVSGSNPGIFGWTGTTAALPEIRLSHVISLGSSGVRIKHSGCRRSGDVAPSTAAEGFFVFAGFFPDEDNTTRTADNAVEDCRIDDVVMGTLLTAQDNFRFADITSRRFPGDHPVSGGLNGHLFYASDSSASRSRGLTINNIVDHGSGVGTLTSRGDSSIQVKSAEGAIIQGVTSKRPTGIMGLVDYVKGVVSDVVYNPASMVTNAVNSGAGLHAAEGLSDNVLKGLTFVLPDSADFSAWNLNAANRNVIEAHVSASFTATSIAATKLTDCDDNAIRLDFAARNATTAIPVQFISGSARNLVEITPVGQNHAIRPFVDNGCPGNVVRIKDNINSKWSGLTHWTTEADSPAIGIEGVKKSKVYRIGTTTNPTTTFQLPRPGVYVGICQMMSSDGSHVLGGLYRIIWDTGSLQSVELIGTEWTIGASAPTVLGLAVSDAGVVTITSTAGSLAWDIQYDFESFGNNRYADF